MSQGRGTHRVLELHATEASLAKYLAKPEEERVVEYIEYLQQLLVEICQREGSACAYLKYRLGLAYLHGEWGLAKSEREARLLLEAAANMGHSLAAYELGRRLALVDADEAGALAAFELASCECDCWAEGSCADEAKGPPHDAEAHRSSAVAQIKVARASNKDGEFAATAAPPAPASPFSPFSSPACLFILLTHPPTPSPPLAPYTHTSCQGQTVLPARLGEHDEAWQR